MSQIPIVIINQNRISTTERLIDQLLLLGYINITILDMDSTYKPLLDWYDSRSDFTVIPWRNSGHKALWNDGLMDKFKQYPWIAVTDSDIELNINTPVDFIEQLIDISKQMHVYKCGLAINYRRIDNLYLRDIIVPIEQRYWDKNKCRHHPDYELYESPIDTSFCVVKPDMPFVYEAIRVAGDFTCTHVPWNCDWNNLSEEERYFIEHTDPKVSTYARHYFQWKTMIHYQI